MPSIASVPAGGPFGDQSRTHGASALTGTFDDLVGIDDDDSAASASEAEPPPGGVGGVCGVRLEGSWVCLGVCVGCGGCQERTNLGCSFTTTCYAVLLGL